MEVKREEMTQQKWDNHSFATTLTEQAKSDLFKGLYCYLGLSGRDICSLLKISRWSLDCHLTKYNIPHRSRGEALSLAFRQGKIKRHYPKGKNHFNWRGGRTTNKEGYVWVMRPEHPRANSYGYVREHILVWEEAHGMPLPKGWVVHHLNGITDDNRPENLVAFPDRKHKHLLQEKAFRIRYLEVALRQAQGEIESLREAMLAGQLTFNFNGHSN